MNIFPLHATDSYKLSHRQMYHPDTTMIYSNLTPRSNRLFKGSSLYDGKMVVFGIQGFIYEFLIETFNNGFFKKPKDKVITIYKRRMDTFLGEGAIPVDGFEKLHDLGYLPLEIRAIAEGSRVPMQIPVLTIKNTQDDFGWLVNYLEAVMSSMLWKPMTNATIAYDYRTVLEHFAELTGTPKELIQWQAHDFSSRGMSGPEDSARSCSGHMLAFTGSDNVLAIDYLEDYYNADASKEMIASSVPATEHSVSCSNIISIMESLEGEFDSEDDKRLEAEKIFLSRYINHIVPTGIASYVADSYDFYGVLTKVVPALKGEILGRDGKLVLRPDSGNPVEIICGTAKVFDTIDEAEEYYSTANVRESMSLEEGHLVYENSAMVDGRYYNVQTIVLADENGDLWAEAKSTEFFDPTPEMKGSVELLWETFGGTITETGHKMLDSHIGLIYGDSITIQRAEEIMSGLVKKGFASGNVVLGVGSFTYSYNTRDTFGMAVKATATAINGRNIEIYKDPKTGAGKKSAKGFLRVDLVDGEYVLTDCVTEEANGGELKVVFRDGVVNPTSLSEIRNRLIGTDYAFGG